MPGVFERLQKEIENKKQAGGISALDLAELTPAMRKIVRLLLRELKMNYPRLREAMENLPVEERLSPAELNLALETLTRQYWLTRIGSGEQAIYKVNLRRRRGSAMPLGIWGTLDSKLKNRPK